MTTLHTYSLNEPTAILNPDMSSVFMRAVNDAAAVTSAKGGYYNRFQNTMSNIDWYNMSPMNTNHEQVGMTFITRPKLNLSLSSLRSDETLSTLITPLYNSFPFAMRCYLDPIFSRDTNILAEVLASRFYNHESPFILPLTNQLTRISGFPQYELHTTTSSEGFYGENQTIAKGNDFGNSTHTITVNFQEMDGGFISNLFFMWIHWISLMKLGKVSRYIQDILEKRLSYTCSIYRLVLDVTRTRVTKVCKLSGCFPTAISMGDFFDIPDRSQYISSTQELQVQFAVNHVEYMKPSILREFNYLMTEFYPNITDASNIILPNSSEFNFQGAPYIAAYDGTNRLLRIGDKNTNQAPLDVINGLARSQVAQAASFVESLYTPDQLRSGRYPQVTEI